MRFHVNHTSGRQLNAAAHSPEVVQFLTKSNRRINQNPITQMHQVLMAKISCGFLNASLIQKPEHPLSDFLNVLHFFLPQYPLNIVCDALGRAV
jgi:hypothetical protein